MVETTHEALLRQTATAEELLTYFQGSRADIDARVAAKEAEVDGFLASATSKLTVAAEKLYDPATLYAKTTAGAVADPADNTRTEWFAVTPSLSSYFYTMNAASYRAVINLSRMYVAAPGYYEDPQYGNDKCSSRIEFVLVGTGTSTEDINTALADQAVDPLNVGAWSYGVYSYELPILVVPGANTGGVLMARFKNDPYVAANGIDENTPSQEIMTFGGNSSFGVSSVKVHLR